ncbi:MAG: LarC family nickel insertion protein [Methanomicrobiales archaeon]|jgi:uncharacterized protein (TIGR00299 family) protein|nr:LarC family nickel insertion protein [Methanomicrobiales archaeon]
MMKRVVLFDPVRGAAGDMIIGAFLDAGVSKEEVFRVMASVGEKPSASKVDRAGIRATSIDTHASDLSRTFAEVIERVEGSSAPDSVISMAKRVFFRIARAEHAVHHGLHMHHHHHHHFDQSYQSGECGDCGESCDDCHTDTPLTDTPLDAFHSMHFHEVGADDAIADVLGACMAMYLLSPDGVVVRPVAVGSGEVTMLHGRYPIPAPATVGIFTESDLVMQMDSSCEHDRGELCTPTGAALLAEFLASFPWEGQCCGSLCAVGYGAGKRNPAGVPNVLRLMVFEVSSEDPSIMSHDEGVVDVLETHVDDVSGEVLGFALYELIQKGARDAVAMPIVMKKGRPGFAVRVIALPKDSARLSREMARLLGTLGVRCAQNVHRFVADRMFREVELLVNGSLYRFPVKFGLIGNECFTLKPEFDLVQECAQKEAVSVLDLSRLIEGEARKMIDGAVFHSSVLNNEMERTQE